MFRLYSGIRINQTLYNNMKLQHGLFALLLFVLQACSPEDPASGPEAAVDATSSDSPPNILFIVADDLGFTDIGAFGGEIATPNLDRLAYGGLRLSNLHAAAYCRPTRLMLMSGAGAVAASQPMEGSHRGGVLSMDYAALPELLQDAGYATYISGKWDLGDLPGHTPRARGFDRSFVELTGSANYFPGTFVGRAFGYEDDGRRLTVEDLPEDFYATEHYTDKMLDYLRSTDEGTPWFAFVPYTAPHWPLQLPDDWLDRNAGRYDAGYDALRDDRFAGAVEAGVMPDGASLENFDPVADPWAELTAEEQRKYSRAQEIYAGMVEYLDMSVGRVIDYLEESGQLENTVIVFTADHGASPGEQGVNTGRMPGGGGPAVTDDIDNSLENFGRAGSYIDHGRGFAEAATAPFKFNKASLTEGGLRAAAFVNYPRAVEAGGVSDAFMSFMDFLPTVLDVAATEHPGAGPYRDGRQINDIIGRSAWPHFTGNAPTVHSETDTVGWRFLGGGALIRGRHKIVNLPRPGFLGVTPWQLYDLQEDPGESHDLAADNPELVAELVREWEANWR